MEPALSSDKPIGRGSFVVNLETYVISNLSPEVLEFYPCLQPGDTCYHAFHARKSPCENCQLELLREEPFSANFWKGDSDRGKVYCIAVLAHRGEGAAFARVSYGTCTNDQFQIWAMLIHQLNFDMISNLYNRKAFFRAVQRQLSARPEGPYQLIRFDIDHFKSINEIFGYEEGNRVLKYVGQVLQRYFNPGEVLGRLENDIFGICARRPTEELDGILADISDKINTYPIDFDFICSFGILTIPYYEGQNPDILWDRTVLAQHKVKGQYLHRYAFYTDEMGETFAREHYIVHHMRQALAGGEFQAYIQPQYNVQEQCVVGGEVLARWYHEPDGWISPGEYIPIFERNGFILKLDEWIWREACQTLRKWIDEGKTPVPLAVNISRMDLRDADFCSKIRNLTVEYQLDPALLRLEITESAYTESQQLLLDIMERLHKQGFLFAMDDFGSGYSSLNMLRNTPVDILKIDLNFLRFSNHEKSGKIILQSVVQMAQNLNMDILAEGVETAEQAEFLEEIGCVQMQGYYYGRPMPIPKFEQTLGYTQ